MLWLLSLRSSYDWMISLSRVPSSFLNIIDLLNFRLYTFCVPQFFHLFLFAKSFFFFFFFVMTRKFLFEVLSKKQKEKKENVISPNIWHLNK